MTGAVHPDRQDVASRPASRACIGMIVVSLALLLGCTPSQTPVSGRVMLDGQPLNEAIILFIPLEAGHKKTGAMIKQGTYEVPQLNGLTPGKYRVEIVDNPPLELAHRPSSERNALLQTRRVLPALYSQRSPLFVELSGASSQNPRQFDFELVSNPPH
jgi:hypothetical protein